MTNDYEIAVSARIPTDNTYLTVPCRANRIANLHLDIRTFVHAVATPSVTAGHVTRSRQTETCHRDMYIFLQTVEHGAIGVHTLVGPDMMVDTIRRVIVHQRRIVHHELRGHLIHHITFLGAHHDLTRQHIQITA